MRLSTPYFKVRDASTGGAGMMQLVRGGGTCEGIEGGRGRLGRRGGAGERRGRFAKPLTETQWQKKGNAICKQINTDLNNIGNDVFAGLGPNDQPTDEQLSSYVEQVLPVVKDGIASINKLEEPKSLKKGIKKFNSEAAKLDRQARLRPDGPPRRPGPVQDCEQGRESDRPQGVRERLRLRDSPS